MKTKFLILLLSLSSFFSYSLHAREVAGINIAETISFSDQSTKLILNGAGIRVKFIFDIYVGSLYLEKEVHTPKDAYSLPGEKRISMHFLYSEVSKEKLINGWNDGFNNNLSKSERQKLKNKIKLFNDLFITVKKDDLINLDFIPTTGTKVVINNKLMGLVESDEFFSALLRIWLGEDPADDELKDAMLGIQTNNEE